MVRGLNSASSEKAVGEGWKVGSGELGEELLSNLRIWFTGAFIGKSLHLPLWFTSSSPHLLPSVQSDLCLFKIQPSLSDSVPAVSHPPGLTNPSPVSSLGLVGVIHKETPGEEKDAGSISVCEEGWEEMLLPEVGEWSSSSLMTPAPDFPPVGSVP